MARELQSLPPMKTTLASVLMLVVLSSIAGCGARDAGDADADASTSDVVGVTDLATLLPETHPMRGRISLELALAQLHGGDPARARAAAEASSAVMTATGAPPDEAAEPALVLRVLDCQAAPSAAARAAVVEALARVVGRPTLSPWRAALYRRSADLCAAPG